jgi:hypothetical protein
VELSTPSAVTTGQLYIPAPQTPYHPIINNPTTSPVTTTPATTTPPTDPNAPTPNPGGTQTGVFGTQEGQPVGWIAIHTSDPSVATVTSAFSAAPSDQMAPIDGYAVLAAPLNAAATDFTAVLTFSDANGNIITTQSVDSAAPLPIAIPHTGSAASSGTSSSGGSPTPLVPTTTPGSQAIIACPPTTAPAVATPAPQTKP